MDALRRCRREGIGDAGGGYGLCSNRREAVRSHLAGTGNPNGNVRAAHLRSRGARRGERAERGDPGLRFVKPSACVASRDGCLSRVVARSDAGRVTTRVALGDGVERRGRAGMTAQFTEALRSSARLGATRAIPGIALQLNPDEMN